MTDKPVFQGHHVVEQKTFKASDLVKKLSQEELFDLHGLRNLVVLPADQTLAARMGLSPHTGGPLSAYTDELAATLRDLEISPDGQATLRGDQAAAKRIAARVHDLTDTLKAGLVNGDLLTNTPQGMTPAQANARIQAFFGDLDGYRQRHASQIADLGRMSAPEARWAGVTKSETRVQAALDAADQPGSSTLSERWGGRQSLGTAIADANQAGRLPVSPDMETRLRTAFPQEMPPTLRGPVPVPGGGVPDSVRGARGWRVAGGAGVALMAYDLVDTGHRVVELRADGNAAGAASAQAHFVGRNAGGILGGFLLGAGYGAVSGSWTGPGAIATGIVGGVGGAYLGDRWAEQRDIDRVYTQADRAGNEWKRDPGDPQGAWTRMARAPGADGTYQEMRVLAGGRLVDELNYRAANDSYSLGLANPPRPRDPYRLDAHAEREPLRAPFEVSRQYVRDAGTGQWQLETREIVDARMAITRHQPVGPDRATALEWQSQAIIAQNASNTPAAIVARYKIAFNQFGWDEFTGREPVPPVIANARARTQELQASDGNTYTRGSDGQWTKPGFVFGDWFAEGNIREELERTWQSQKVGLQELSALAEEARANSTPTQRDLRSQVAGAYARAGEAPGDADIDAATAAVERAHAGDDGFRSQGPYFLQLQDDGSIATVSGQDGKRMEVTSVVTAADIARERSLQQGVTQAQPSGAPAAGDDAPEAQGARSHDSGQEPSRAPDHPHRLQPSAGMDGSHDDARATATGGGSGAAPAAASNPWHDTAAGRYVEDYMAALERGDEAQMRRLAENHAQAPQFREWEAWGKDNQQQRELEQQRQQAAPVQEAPGLARC